MLIADKIFGLRVTPFEELLGADYCEHGILPRGNQALMDVINKKDIGTNISATNLNKVDTDHECEVAKEAEGKDEWRVNEAFQHEHEASRTEEQGELHHEVLRQDTALQIRDNENSENHNTER